MSAALLDFVKDASRLGKSRSEMNAALSEAGWPQDQLTAFWSIYHESSFPVPVPKPRAYASPRLTTMSLFYFVVLYISIYSVIDIVFTWLDYNLTDGHGQMRGVYYSSMPYFDNIKESLASLIACVPLVYISNRIIQRSMQATGQFIHATRLKLLNLTMFIAALIVLGDIITAVYYLLSNDLSVRFGIKVGILGAISAIAYYRFQPEMAAYEKKA